MASASMNTATSSATSNAMNERMPPAELSKAGFRVFANRDEIRALRNQYARQHAIHLPNFLAPELLSDIGGRLEASAFHFRTNEVNRELNASDEHAVGLLLFVLNDPTLWNFVAEVTGVNESIQRFVGRCYRMLPIAQHYFEWHDDMDLGRMVSLSINLTSKPYQGGLLQIRERNTERVVYELANTGYGDAVLFRVDEKLEHRVTNVSGDVPKTSFAGWFCSGQSFGDFVREQANK